METEKAGGGLSLRKRVDLLEEEVQELKDNLKVSLNIIAELLGDDGTITITLTELKKELNSLKDEIIVTDDAIGDSKNINALINSVDEIKAKLGIR